MKVEIEIDLTPEEARTLLGLPDLKPLHDAYLGRMQSFIEKGVTPEMMGDMVRSWSSLGGAGMGLIQQVLGGMVGSKSSSGTSADADSAKSGSRKR
jgi:Family of unknown function (DUF6489)